MQTRKLLALLRERLPEIPPFEMREVEMSLCEYDKYVRLLLGQGKSKRTYRGGATAGEDAEFTAKPPDTGTPHAEGPVSAA